jgi:hypothetical protein
MSPLRTEITYVCDRCGNQSDLVLQNKAPKGWVLVALKSGEFWNPFIDFTEHGGVVLCPRCNGQFAVFMQDLRPVEATA